MGEEVRVELGVVEGEEDLAGSDDGGDAEFDFTDFLEMFAMMNRMGPLQKVLGMLPGMSNVRDLQIDEKQIDRTKAIVLSMTLEERAKPDILNARRRQRIARGSGTSVTAVNELITRFNEMRKMMKQMPRMQKMMAKSTGRGLFKRG